MSKKGMVSRDFVISLLLVVVVIGGTWRYARYQMLHPPTEKIRNRQKLVALTDSRVTEGSGIFLLASGGFGVGETLCVTYAIETPYGIQIKKERLENSDVYIQETDDETPQRYEVHYTGIRCCCTQRVVFIVPKGSVKRTFEVDLE